MKSAYAELKAFRQSWQALRDAKPTEADFSQFNIESANASDFDTLFDEWDKNLAAAITSASNGADDKVFDLMLVTAFRDAKGQVEAANANNFGWLIRESPFLEIVAQIQVALVPVVEKRFRLKKGVMQFAQSKLVDDIASVEQGALLAKELSDAQTRIQQQAEQVALAVTDVENSKTKASTEADDIRIKLEQVGSNVESVIQAKAGFDANVTETKRVLDEANALLDGVKAFRAKSDLSLKEGTEALDLANFKLSKAFADINQQALADSFAQKARGLMWEWIGWIVGFAAAIGWLVWVAFYIAKRSSLLDAIVVSHLSTAQAPSILDSLFHALPFVIPGVWLGWLSAKNAGLTARVRQDYNYKVATALAFKGYKNEVGATEDKDLQRQLMQIAIANFGQNPIRIYEGKDELGHPLEALKSIFQDDKLFAKFLDFVKASKPTVGG